MRASARICASGATSWVKAEVGMIVGALGGVDEQDDGASAAGYCGDAMERRGDGVGHGVSPMRVDG